MIATRVWEIKGKQYHEYREINCNNINKRKLIEKKSKLLDRQMEIGVYHHIRFPECFFAVIYDLWIIHSSYLISCFGAGNKMIDLCSHIGIVQVVINYLLFYRYIQCFTIGNAF